MEIKYTKHNLLIRQCFREKLGQVLNLYDRPYKVGFTGVMSDTPSRVRLTGSNTGGSGR